MTCESVWNVFRFPENHKYWCVCVCVFMSVCELGPCCLGGGGNSISLRPKEFRPLEQGHVLMFSRSFLRSQTVTFNRHSNYPTMPSGSVLRLCSTSLAHVTVKTADSGLCPLLELKKMDTEMVSVHLFLYVISDGVCVLFDTKTSWIYRLLICGRSFPRTLLAVAWARLPYVSRT